MTIVFAFSLSEQSDDDDDDDTDHTDEDIDDTAMADVDPSSLPKGKPKPKLRTALARVRKLNKKAKVEPDKCDPNIPGQRFRWGSFIFAKYVDKDKQVQRVAAKVLKVRRRRQVDERIT